MGVQSCVQENRCSGTAYTCLSSFATGDYSYIIPVIINREPEATYTILEVTREEVLAEFIGIENRKTPGPDGIAKGAFNVAIRNRPDIFTNVFYRCFLQGIFPRIWKVQKLILIPKSGKKLNM